MPANETGTMTLSLGWKNDMTGAGQEAIDREFVVTLGNYQEFVKEVGALMMARLDNSMKKHAK